MDTKAAVTQSLCCQKAEGLILLARCHWEISLRSGSVSVVCRVMRQPDLRASPSFWQPQGRADPTAPFQRYHSAAAPCWLFSFISTLSCCHRHILSLSCPVHRVFGVQVVSVPPGQLSSNLTKELHGIWHANAIWEKKIWEKYNSNSSEGKTRTKKAWDTETN